MADYLTYDRGKKRWKYIRGVPSDLRSALGGKKFWTQHIGSVPHSAAAARARELAADHDKIIEALRKLSPEHRAEIAGTVVYMGGSPRDKLPDAARDKLSKFPAKPPKIFRGLDAWKLKVELDARALRFLEAARGDASPELEAVLNQHFLSSADLRRRQIQDPLPNGSEAEIALAHVQANAAVVNMRAEIDRDRGITRAMSEGEYALTPLANAWGKNKSSNVARRIHGYVKRFAECVGDLGPTEVKRDHIFAFRDTLHDAGKKHNYVKDQLDKLHSLFTFAVSEKWCAWNPVTGIKARKDSPQDQNEDEDDLDKSFTADQTREIFKMMKGESEDFQWVTRLVAYHGARSGEVCQLRCKDITQAHGIDVMRINSKDGKSVKNKRSIRVAPLHPKVRRELIAFAHRIAKVHGPDAWLFQTSYQTRDDKLGPAYWYQRRGSMFIRNTLGITNKKGAMHRLRHRFISLCRELDCPETVSSAITGHSLGKGEHGAYGGAPSLTKRVKWLAKVDPLKG